MLITREVCIAIAEKIKTEEICHVRYLRYFTNKIWNASEMVNFSKRLTLLVKGNIAALFDSTSIMKCVFERIIQILTSNL